MTDTKTNQYWSGSANAGLEDLTSAVVTFSPLSIETGASKTDPDSIYVPGTATVAPKDLVQKVSIDNFVTLPGGSGSADVKQYPQTNISTGQITFNLYGKTGTAKSMPNGDVEMEAKDGSTVLGTDMVIVQVPKAIGNSVYAKYGGNGVTTAVDPTNMALNVNTSPSVPGIPAGEVGLFTGVQQAITVPVVDQFGKALGLEYDGQEVYETINNAANPVTINQKLKNSSYNDPVGFYSPNAPTQVPAGSRQASEWVQKGAPQFPIASPQSGSPTIDVSISGFTLAPTVSLKSQTTIPGNRKIAYASKTSGGSLTIVWNAP